MPHRLTLTRMAEQIRSKSLSPVELLEAHLRQIEKHNPQLNAFIRVFADESRAVAKDLEAAQMRGEFAGSLHGVPVTIKDSFDMVGYPTTCGSLLFGSLPASKDATAVRRFRSAGAIPIAKTNCPEFLANYESDNFVIGRTNNPWNVDRTSGGSSGGEAAAIAAFCSAGGIGSDGGGSVRVPSHFCGIAGLKPTPGRVSA
ncbi:MAG: amidase, partial [Acidobacteriaceae bacterium]|nr:amidase [Acidobacteriaceae bacterium]